MDVEDLSKRVRESCLEAVLRAYEDAVYRASVLMDVGKQL